MNKKDKKFYTCTKFNFAKKVWIIEESEDKKFVRVKLFGSSFNFWCKRSELKFFLNKPY